MNPRSLAKLSAALCAGTLLVSLGCDKNRGDREKTDAQNHLEKQAAVANATALKSAEPNSFEEVSARLDRGGSLYFYLSPTQWLANLSGQIVSFRDKLLSSSGGKPNSPEAEKAQRAFDIAADFVRKSGLEEISGVGASSFATERGVYRNKFFVHHYQGKGNGILWTAFGKAPHRLTGLDLLPADAVLASFTDLDLAQVIGFLRQEVDQSGIPEVKQSVDQSLAEFSKIAGMPIDEVLQSLGGSIGLILTLDRDKVVALPGQAGAEKIPTPRLAILVQVKDDRIFKQIDKVMTANPALVRVDEPDLQMRTISAPLLPELELRATVAQWGGYLVLASDDKLIRDLIAAQKAGNGLKATSAFGKLVADLPEEGNGFQLITQRFADTWNHFQAGLIKNQPGSTPEQRLLMEQLLAYQKAGASYSVFSHLENGWLVVGKGTQGANQMIVPLIVAPAAVAAGVALPVLAKVRNKATATRSVSQIKQLGIACKLYATDNYGKFPPSLEALVPDYLPGSQVFISPFAPNVPMGYNYTAGLTEKSPPDTVLIEDKFAADQHERVVCHVDMSTEVILVQ